jgi:copper chaperone
MVTKDVERFHVAGMTCGHCVKAVTAALLGLDPEAEVSIDLTRGLVEVASAAPRAHIAQAIEGEGYAVAP